MAERKKYYHVNEVADMVGCSMNDVYLAMRDKRLDGYKLGRKWLVKMDQKDAFDALRRMVADRKAAQDAREITEEREEYIRYVEDDEHSAELLSRILNVRKSLCISTANLKNLYLPVQGSGEKVPFLKFLEDLVRKGVSVSLLYSRLSSVLYDEKDKYPDLMSSLLFHPQVCGMVHMKMFIFDEEEVYIGSANITNAAIGNRAKKAKNFEAGIITNSRDVVDRAVKHFTKAWEKDCSDCPIWEECCNKDQL